MRAPVANLAFGLSLVSAVLGCGESDAGSDTGGSSTTEAASASTNPATGSGGTTDPVTSTTGAVTSSGPTT